jgi:hypothetical protein
MGKKQGSDRGADFISGRLASWTRARACSGGTCVEAKIDAGGLAHLRDSKHNLDGPSQPIISLTIDQFCTFQDELLGLIPAGANGEISREDLADGWVAFRSASTGVELRYDADEYSDFVEGVGAGDFRPVLTTT